MKTTIKIIVFCLLFNNVNANVKEVNLDTAQNVFTSETTNGDTVTKHKIFEVDDHLIIVDSVLIFQHEDLKIELTPRNKDLKTILLPLFTLIFAVIVILRKNKKNG